MVSPEDILSGSLQSLYSYTPVTFSSPKIPFTHTSSGLTFATPDPAASNWGLHASSVWVASLFLANHLDEVTLELSASNIDVLELGAGTGLPGILFARRHLDKANVTLSDYPDDNILDTLKRNIEINCIPPALVQVVGHVWGENTTDVGLGVFDIVLAADTLWNSEMHVPFCRTLSCVLRRNDTARVYLVAGLHTGRWVIHRFLERLMEFGLSTDQIKERSVNDGDVEGEANDTFRGPSEREWTVNRDGEDDKEKRKWVVWIVVKWLDAQPRSSFP